MFDWDESNISHIARHGVTPEEAEQALSNNPSEAILQVHDNEERYYQIGMTDAHRCLVLVTTWRNDGQIRIVTAYPASPALRRMYLKRKGL